MRWLRWWVSWEWLAWYRCLPCEREEGEKEGMNMFVGASPWPQLPFPKQHKNQPLSFLSHVVVCTLLLILIVRTHTLQRYKIFRSTQMHVSIYIFIIRNLSILWKNKMRLNQLFRSWTGRIINQGNHNTMTMVKFNYTLIILISKAPFYRFN